jgi:hypothetical protein
VLEHIGVLIDTHQMPVLVTERKVRMRKMAKELLMCAQMNRRLVSLEKVRHFCDVAVSLTLALPMARLYTRSLYWDMYLGKMRVEEGGESTREVRIADRGERGLCGGPNVNLPERGSAQRDKPLSAPGDAALTLQHRRSSEPRWGKIRLSRQPLIYLVYWRSLIRGEGRDLHPPPADLTMHSAYADVGYGGTFGMCSEAGSQRLWEYHGLWATEERTEPINLRELKAVRLLLQKHFASFVAKAETKRILLHEDNQAVVHILNAMISASRPMMAELWRLEVMLRILGIKMEARWIPSAVNRYVDALSPQWDPGDVCSSEELVESLCSA